MRINYESKKDFLADSAYTKEHGEAVAGCPTLVRRDGAAGPELQEVASHVHQLDDLLLLIRTDF